jgi:hypothetical protein
MLWLARRGANTTEAPPASPPPGDGWVGPGRGLTTTAVSGRTYTLWTWTRPGQTYAVARLAGSTAWLSFTRAEGSSPVPAKTNSGSDAALLGQMRSDWGM